MGNTDKSELHYNFVFFFAESEFWQAVIGKDLYRGKNSRVYKGAFEGSTLLKKLFKYHWAYRVNAVIDLPLKRVWFKRMYEQDFQNGNPLCFVYLGGNMIRRDRGWCKYVRKRDSRNRQIIMHQDIIGKKIHYDYGLVRDKVDAAVTVEKNDALKYGIDYFREDVYTKLIEEPEHVEFEQDVYLLAAAKDRLPKIMATYEYLKAHGLTCKFVLTGVEPSLQQDASDIVYTNWIDYGENLRNIIASRCVLEIIQGEMADITTRTVEAIAYRRKLITDCSTSKHSDFNDGQLCVFDSPEEIDTEWVLADYDPDGFPPQIDLDPMRRLRFFQSCLDRENRNE